MTGDLAAFTAFFAAMLDEDEAAAKAAAADGTPAWHLDDSEPDPTIGVSRIYDANGEVVVYDEGSPSPNEAEHIARHDPARVLREVEAGRRLLARYRDVAAEYERFPHGATMMVRDALADEMANRAAVWSDHPDYRAEWKP